jgi:hypothetical protein
MCKHKPSSVFFVFFNIVWLIKERVSIWCLSVRSQKVWLYQTQEIPTIYMKFALIRVEENINFNTSISHGKGTKVGLAE